ncbi:heterokaryon incompatibility protein-domain-containing protein [Xylariaceae sp. FL0804]|nr:heterokaryon incompatibility protein-domain-containing protein [Xylariaceae sp. FL0804]
MAPCQRWRDELDSAKTGGLINLPEEPSQCCEVCRAVAALLKPDQAQDDLCVEWNRSPRSIELIHFDFSPEAPLWRIRVLAAPDKPCPWGIFPSAATEQGPQGMLSPLPALGRIAYMIRECQVQHSCVSAEDMPLPTRVIQVGEADSEVRLVETGGDMKAPYICLSHCWGDHQPLTTTRGNKSEHLRSLPWDEVPQSYRDLIQLTRLLNIEYIWIDSLCIVQDDAEDWMRESQRMCQVYENSFLTVAATAAPDCSHELWGFLDPPDSGRTETAGETEDQGEPYSLLAIRVPYSHPTSVDQGHWRRRLWPLLDRAWVFQEVMLSPRVLHFSRWELLWECRARTTCDCGRIRPRDKDEHFARVVEEEEGGAGRSTSTSTLAEVEAMWRETVQGFSGLRLTFARDKYMALAGLADKFSRLRRRRRRRSQDPAASSSSSSYLAGLWSDSLARDLLWLNLHAIPHYRRNADHEVAPSLGRAPSWSWMKMNSRVAFADSPHRFPSYLRDTETAFDDVYFAVEDAACVPAAAGDGDCGAFAFGPVERGSVRLRCLVFDADMRPMTFPAGTTNVYGTQIDGRELPALRLPLTATTDIGFAPENLGPRVGQLYYADAPADPTCGHGPLEPAGTGVACVPMARARRSWVFEGRTCWEVDEWIMVLLPVVVEEEEEGGDDDGRYIRIGMALLRKRYEGEAQAVEAASSPDWRNLNGREVSITIV